MGTSFGKVDSEGNDLGFLFVSVTHQIFGETKIESPGEDLVNVWQVHFKTVFVFINALAHPLKLSGLVKLVCCFSVDCQVSQRSGVFGTLTESTLG